MLLTLSVLIIATACNVEARLEAEGIIGGVPTEPYEIKYHVSLQFMKINWCGGSIIDEQFVITAAHCVVDENNKFLIAYPFKVVAGINDMNIKDGQDGVEIDMEKIYIPTAYNKHSKTSTGDIAVIKLKKKFDLGSSLMKVQLPKSTEKELNSNNSYVGSEPLITGFGWDQIMLIPIGTYGNKTKYKEEGSSSGKLLKAKALIIDNTECQNSYKKYVIHDAHICANMIQHPKNVHQGVCSGDSGGPLVFNGTQIGIVSFNYLGCDDRERPAVYTRLSAYISFINKAMNDTVTEDIRAQVWPDNV